MIAGDLELSETLVKTQKSVKSRSVDFTENWKQNNRHRIKTLSEKSRLLDERVGSMTTEATTNEAKVHTSVRCLFDTRFMLLMLCYLKKNL